jgi:hypothetical protein
VFYRTFLAEKYDFDQNADQQIRRFADKRPAISKWSFIKPVLNFTVCFQVSELPKELDVSPVRT